MDLTIIFYYSDEFSKSFEKQVGKHLLSDGRFKRQRSMQLTLGEVITIMIYYHYSGFKTFKDYYTKEPVLKSAFPKLVSYNRFIELKAKAAVPMALFIRLFGLGNCTGISFIDSFSIKACHIKREHSHKVLKGIAKKGKTSVGWFFGIKVHLIINHNADLIDFYVTRGNVVDNNLQVIKRLCSSIFGKVYGDKGYLLKQELTSELSKKDIHFVTKVRKNMKTKELSLIDRLLLRKRAIIESAIAIIKQQFNIEYGRHRSPIAFFAHICSALMAYSFKEKKPSLGLQFNPLTCFA